MSNFTKPASMAAIVLFTVAACDMSDGASHEKARNGAAIGAAVGAIGGLIVGDDHEGAVRGAVLGGLIGGAVGNQLDKQEADLRNSIGNSGAVITNTGSELIVTLPEAITFGSGSTLVRQSLLPSLDQLTQSLMKYPDTRVEIIGHTDSVGNESYNMGLSNRRAGSVNRILSGNGLPSSRSSAFGRGETSPVASNSSASGRAQNRRVEVIIRPVT